jgi:hypothetical protein
LDCVWLVKVSRHDHQHEQTPDSCAELD